LKIIGKSTIHVLLRVLRPSEVPALSDDDLVILTGKIHSIEAVTSWLAKKISGRTGIIALQNGIGPEDIIEKGLQRSVDRGLVFFGAHCLSQGKCQYYPGRIRMKPSTVAEGFCKLLEDTAVKCEISDNFKKTVWQKAAINCIANPLSGILRINNREITQDLLDPGKDALLKEVKEVARAEGVVLHIGVEQINRYLDQDNIPSLRTDLERGMPTEIDFINGAVARIGRYHGIATPANDLVVSIVKFLEKRGYTFKIEAEEHDKK
jgi:2-dehydropantoate 2-reductase